MSIKTKSTICFALIIILLVGALSVILYRVISPKEPTTVIDQTTQDELNEAVARVSALEAEVNEKESEIAGLRSAVASYESRIQTLISGSTSDSELVKQLQEQLSVYNGRITALSEQVSNKNEEIRLLNEKIASIDLTTYLDVSQQLSEMTSLVKTLTSNAPRKKVVQTISYEVLNPSTGNLEMRTTEVEYEAAPSISMYYEDLLTGYSLSFDSSRARYAASLIKVPYLFSVVLDILSFYENRYFYDDEGNLLYDIEGNKLFEGEHPNFDENGNLIFREGEERYNLANVWTYDADTMNVNGSGIIKKEATGFQLTYRELFEYAILYSDNIAFSEIQKMFTRDPYLNKAKELGTKGQSKGFMQLSCDDCAIWLKELYQFFESCTTMIDEEMTFGQWFKDLMLRAGMNYLIGGGTGNDPVAHKYGWDEDSFHDMAIVYNEHPYILIIMTDLDEGTNAENNTIVKYIVSVSKNIASNHKSMYKKIAEAEAKAQNPLS